MIANTIHVASAQASSSQTDLLHDDAAKLYTLIETRCPEQYLMVNMRSRQAWAWTPQGQPAIPTQQQLNQAGAIIDREPGPTWVWVLAISEQAYEDFIEMTGPNPPVHYHYLQPNGPVVGMHFEGPCRLHVLGSVLSVCTAAFLDKLRARGANV